MGRTLNVEEDVVRRAEAFDKLEQWLLCGGKVAIDRLHGKINLFTVPTQHVEGCCLMDAISAGKFKQGHTGWA